MIGNRTQSIVLTRVMELYPELLDISHATMHGHDIEGIRYKDQSICSDDLKLVVSNVDASCYHVGIVSAENKQYWFDHIILDITVTVDEPDKKVAYLKLADNHLSTDSCVKLIEQGIEIYYTNIDGNNQKLDSIALMRKHTIDKIASYDEHIR